MELSAIHPEWQSIVRNALQTMDKDYLQQLILDDTWLPGINNIFASFRRDRINCKYILFGESPYPRKKSANGIAFYDATVTNIWSDKGLSTDVNKATSLRNIIKTMLVSENFLEFDNDGKVTQNMIANLDKDPLIKTISQLFKNLEQRGFLLLNSTPVLSQKFKPQQEAKYWQNFIQSLLDQLEKNNNQNKLPVLILWGKISTKINTIAPNFIKICCEHPYNLSFISNLKMQRLFAKLQLLSREI